MTKHVSVPVRLVNGELWGDLSVFGRKHHFCAEKIDKKDDKFSFAGGHRVRLYTADKSVHWKIIEGTQLDITEVTPTARRPR